MPNDVMPNDTETLPAAAPAAAKKKKAKKIAASVAPAPPPAEPATPADAKIYRMRAGHEDIFSWSMLDQSKENPEWEVIEKIDARVKTACCEVRNQIGSYEAVFKMNSRKKLVVVEVIEIIHATLEAKNPKFLPVLQELLHARCDWFAANEPPAKTPEEAIAEML